MRNAVAFQKEFADSSASTDSGQPALSMENACAGLLAPILPEGDDFKRERIQSASRLVRT